MDIPLEGIISSILFAIGFFVVVWWNRNEKSPVLRSLGLIFEPLFLLGGILFTMIALFGLWHLLRLSFIPPFCHILGPC